MADPDSTHRMIDSTSLFATSLDGVGKGFGMIVRAFAEVAGDDLARMATATRLRDGVLTVRCVSSAWAQTIGFLEHDIVERLQQRLPNERIERIHTVSGGVAPPPPPPPPLPPLTPLEPAALARLEAMVAHISDPHLRSQVLTAAIRSEQRRREPVNPTP